MKFYKILIYGHLLRLILGISVHLFNLFLTLILYNNVLNYNAKYVNLDILICQHLIPLILSVLLVTPLIFCISFQSFKFLFSFKKDHQSIPFLNILFLIYYINMLYFIYNSIYNFILNYY